MNSCYWINFSDELQRYKRQSIEKEELRVFHSDPLDYHSILDALKGCSALFYSFELPSDHPTYDVSSSSISERERRGGWFKPIKLLIFFPRGVWLNPIQLLNYYFSRVEVQLYIIVS